MAGSEGAGRGWGVLPRDGHAPSDSKRRQVGSAVLMKRSGILGARTAMLSQASSICDPQLVALPHLAAL